MQEKRLKRRIDFLEIYQIIGGIVGLLITIYLLLTSDLHKYNSIIGYITIIFPFLFFGFCIYSGVLLNTKKYAFGLKLVFISFLFQLIEFEIFGLFYSSVNGLGIKIKFDLTNDIFFGFDYHPSHFLFQTSSNFEVFIVKINFVAIFMLYFIFNTYHDLKKNESL